MTRGRSPRERLLGALVDMVGQNGYAAATLDGLLERASTDRETFAELFGSLEDCLIAAYDAIVDDAARHVIAAQREGRDARERLKLGVGALLDYCAAHPDETRLCFVEALHAGPRARARRDLAMREFARLLRIHRAAEANGSEPDIVPDVIVGGVYEVIYSRVAADRIDELPELLPQLVQGGLLALVRSA